MRVVVHVKAVPIDVVSVGSEGAAGKRRAVGLVDIFARWSAIQPHERQGHLVDHEEDLVLKLVYVVVFKNKALILDFINFDVGYELY